MSCVVPEQRLHTLFWAIMNNMLVNVQLHMSRKLMFLCVLMSEIRFFLLLLPGCILDPTSCSVFVCTHSFVCVCWGFYSPSTDKNTLTQWSLGKVTWLTITFTWSTLIGRLKWDGWANSPRLRQSDWRKCQSKQGALWAWGLTHYSVKKRQKRERRRRIGSGEKEREVNITLVRHLWCQ